jgi:hypothetical protein
MGRVAGHGASNLALSALEEEIQAADDVAIFVGNDSRGRPERGTTGAAGDVLRSTAA